MSIITKLSKYPLQHFFRIWTCSFYTENEIVLKQLENILKQQQKQQSFKKHFFGNLLKFHWKKLYYLLINYTIITICYLLKLQDVSSVTLLKMSILFYLYNDL